MHVQRGVMQRELVLRDFGSASVFLKSFPFHAGRSEPAARRAPFWLRAVPHIFVSFQ